MKEKQNNEGFTMMTTDTKEVATQIKNKELVKERRRQIVDAAVPLFIERGYHKTTTRALAQATGLSIGSMYEYITTKDDVLYLVCMAIHAEVEHGVADDLAVQALSTQVLGEEVGEAVGLELLGAERGDGHRAHVHVVARGDQQCVRLRLLEDAGLSLTPAAWPFAPPGPPAARPKPAKGPAFRIASYCLRLSGLPRTP